MADKFYKSINQAWLQFGEKNWQISRRTFFNYVGKGKQVPPLNGKYYEDDISELALQLGWVPIGQVAEADQPDDEGLTGDSAKRFQEAKAKDKECEAELKRLKLNKELGKLIDRENVEMIMAGKTAVLDTAQAMVPEVYGHSSPKQHIATAKELMIKNLDHMPRAERQAMLMAYDALIEAEQGLNGEVGHE